MRPSGEWPDGSKGNLDRDSWRDLERLAADIAEDSPGYAAAFVRRVREHAQSLDAFTLHGSPPSAGGASTTPTRAARLSHPSLGRPEPLDLK